MKVSAIRAFRNYNKRNYTISANQMYSAGLINNKAQKSSINFSNNVNTVTANQDATKTHTLENEAVKISAIAAAGVTILGIVAIIASNKKKSANFLNDIIITDKTKFKNIISKFTHDDFDVTKNFKVNLHMHSTMSDGKMPPLEILRQANERAQQLPNGEKFTFSLTDHDSIEGVKIIAEEITKYPKKYSRLNFVPGIEMSARYHNPALSNQPVEFDFLIYGFDINNQPLIKQIEKRHSYLKEHTQLFFDELNDIAKSDLSVEKMQKTASNPHLKHLVSNGYLKALTKYAEDYCYENKFDARGKISQLAQKHFGNNLYAFDANIELLDAVRLAQEANAFCSIAHPGKFNFNHAELKSQGVVLSNDIISKFLKSGGDGLECHYMAYPDRNIKWWEDVRNAFKKLGLPYDRTGGYDCHGKMISSKH